MWKSRLLSPAGKLVLLKSVIESLTIYHMSTTLLHNSMLEKIKSKCIQFFWGKANNKAICYVKWDRLTTSKLHGGLGLRNLHSLNKAMVIKNIWKLISGHEALWVRIMAAKYHNSTSFWSSQRSTGCSRLWQAIMQYRNLLANYVQWVIRNGHTCPAYSQPWFQQWRTMQPPSRAQCLIRVDSLFSNTDLSWDREALTQFGGEEMANRILQEHSKMVLNPDVPDKLMYTWASNGAFSVKAAYNMVDQLQPLIRLAPLTEHEKLWKKIWKTQGVLPRVRIFFLEDPTGGSANSSCNCTKNPNHPVCL